MSGMLPGGVRVGDNSGNASFLPEDYLRRRLERRTNAICIMLFVAVMIGVAGAFFVTNRQSKDLQIEQQELTRQVKTEAERIKQLEELQKQKDEHL